ncbi:hypothetical protein [Desulfopila sp. IMCC35008]|uniref:hypothetical protein n=1 Tax=Desulfopila sp. IMCC35008 TaxID=2653858 RepID=UPI0013D16BBE|nr:hypothetical protein [Desulfopila sp. IMCC35008]
MNDSTLSQKLIEVLVDSSSLILLYKAHLLPALCSHYRPVIASEVFREVTQNNKPGADECYRRIRDKEIIVLPHITKPLHPDLKAHTTMGAGELKTLHHALSGTASFIIIDDLQAIRYCIRKNIPFINALLVPRILALAGAVPYARSHHDFATLCKTGHYSSGIIKKANILGSEELRQFFPF